VVPKLEARNPNVEIRNKFEFSRTKIQNKAILPSFRHLSIRILDLFRTLDFEIRIFMPQSPVGIPREGFMRPPCSQPQPQMPSLGGA